MDKAWVEKQKTQKNPNRGSISCIQTPMAAKPKLSVEARRARTLLISLPIMVGTAFVLYKRLVLEEGQRKLPTTVVVTTSDSGTRQAKAG